MNNKLNKNARIILAMSNIQIELKKLNLWSDGSNKPSNEAFLSNSPFFMDTMEFHQWLEFVLIPRFTLMVQNNEPLPQGVQIHPYAQEIYRGKWQEYKELITKLREFDKLFN